MNNLFSHEMKNMCLYNYLLGCCWKRLLSRKRLAAAAVVVVVAAGCSTIVVVAFRSRAAWQPPGRRLAPRWPYCMVWSRASRAVRRRRSRRRPARRRPWWGRPPWTATLPDSCPCWATSWPDRSRRAQWRRESCCRRRHLPDDERSLCLPLCPTWLESSFLVIAQIEQHN